ncbi:exonuclease domain-containing protein [Glaciihabitans sp. UYNi722]|uniref:exonuclease domain-containing protein n=1 Tax=Glaciihabitans sp. UYNi722 TaxID=3156344 RepID=UPI0033930839
MDKIWYETLGVFDLETTGIDTETSRIVSAYVGVVDAAGEAKGVSWLADPGVEIPAQAAAVHGITTERARAEGREAPEVVAEIVAVLRSLLAQNVPVVIYNAAYDLTLLNRESLRYGIEPLDKPSPIIDPLVIDRAMDRYRKGKRTLEVAAEFYGVDLADAHDAQADAVAAGRVAQAISQRYFEQLGHDVHALHALQVVWAAESAQSFQEYMRRSKDPDFVADGLWPER